MTSDPLALAEDVEAATARFLASAATLTEPDVAKPSLLPGWTRGHVLTHVARNADGLTNLLTWARTGVETPMYPNAEARVAGIEAGADRQVTDQLADLRESSARFAAAVAEMPAPAWAFVYGERRGAAARVVWRRLREVEVHHVDLDWGYGSADWPSGFTHRLLHELISDRPLSSGDLPRVRLVADEFNHPLYLGDRSSDLGEPSSDLGDRSSHEPPITVRGPGHELAAWLSGRGSGAALTVDPAGPLPTVPDWM